MKTYDEGKNSKDKRKDLNIYLSGMNILLFLLAIVFVFIILIKTKSSGIHIEYVKKDMDSIYKIDKVLLQIPNEENRVLSVPTAFRIKEPFDILIPLENKDLFEDKILCVHLPYLNLKCYVDEQCIYEYEIPKDNFKKTGYNSLHIISLPNKIKDSTIRLKCEPVIGDRINSKITMVATSSGIGHIKNYFIKDVINIVLASILFIAFLLINIFNILLNGIQRYDFQMANLSLICLAIAVYVLSQSEMVYVFTTDSMWYFPIYVLEFTSLALTPVPVILYIKKYLDIKFEKILNFSALVLMGNVFVQSVLVAYTRLEFVEMLRISHILIVLSLLVMWVSFIFTDSKKYREKMKLCKSIVPLWVTFFIGLVAYTFSFRINYKLILLIGAILFVIVQAYILFSEYKKAYEKNIEHLLYKKMATMDALTKLQNRFSYMQKIEYFKNNKNAYTSVGIVVIDMNDLKGINDSLGHEYGDRAIIFLSECLLNYFNVYEKDAIYRIGGDEFVILLKDISKTDLENITDMLNRLEGRPYTVGGEELHLSFAIGTNMFFAKEKDSIEKAIYIADMKMYRDKAKKTNME